MRPQVRVTAPLVNPGSDSSSSREPHDQVRPVPNKVQVILNGHYFENLDIEKPEAFSRGLQGDTHPTIRRHSGEVSVGQLLQGFKPHMEEKP